MAGGRAPPWTPRFSARARSASFGGGWAARASRSNTVSGVPRAARRRTRGAPASSSLFTRPALLAGGVAAAFRTIRASGAPAFQRESTSASAEGTSFPSPCKAWKKTGPNPAFSRAPRAFASRGKEIPDLRISCTTSRSVYPIRFKEITSSRERPWAGREETKNKAKKKTRRSLFIGVSLVQRPPGGRGLASGVLAVSLERSKALGRRTCSGRKVGLGENHGRAPGEKRISTGKIPFRSSRKPALPR